jgi:hypothetical protein
MKVLTDLAVPLEASLRLQADGILVRGSIREGIAESIRAFHDDGLPSNKLSSNGHAF